MQHKVILTADEVNYLLQVIKMDIEQDRENDLEPCAEAFDIEAKLNSITPAPADFVGQPFAVTR